MSFTDTHEEAPLTTQIQFLCNVEQTVRVHRRRLSSCISYFSPWRAWHGDQFYGRRRFGGPGDLRHPHVIFATFDHPRLLAPALRSLEASPLVAWLLALLVIGSAWECVGGPGLIKAKSSRAHGFARWRETWSRGPYDVVRSVGCRPFLPSHSRHPQ